MLTEQMNYITSYLQLINKKCIGKFEKSTAIEKKKEYIFLTQNENTTLYL